MKLKDSLYYITRQSTGNKPLQYEVLLDEHHFIYQAHFPGEPITPGVCIIQIAEELLEYHLNQMLNIQTVKNVKFLNFISPLKTPRITYEFAKIIVDDIAKTCKVQVQVLSDEEILAKLSFTCMLL